MAPSTSRRQSPPINRANSPTGPSAVNPDDSLAEPAGLTAVPGLAEFAACTLPGWPIQRRRIGALRHAFGRRNPGRGVHTMAATLDWSQCPAVESVPGRVSGAWTFRNSRTPVQVVFENLEDVMTVEEIIEQYPVSRDEINAVLEFAARDPSTRVPSESILHAARRCPESDLAPVSLSRPSAPVVDTS